jgi:hypothetical protein
MKLTLRNLGMEMHRIIYRDYPTAAAAARAIDADPLDFRRAWGRGNNASRHLSYARICEYFERLGYDVHFTVEKRDDANRILHTNHPPQSMPVHNGRER